MTGPEPTRPSDAEMCVVYRGALEHVRARLTAVRVERTAALASLGWAMAHIPEPTRRIPGPFGNAPYFDAYQVARQLLAADPPAREAPLQTREQADRERESQNLGINLG